MSYLYHMFIYEPLYNGLIFFLGVLPSWGNAGLAIILLTILVRLILFPLSRTAIRTQVRMKELEPEMKRIREEYKNNKEKQSLEILRLYRENKLNPFSSFFLILIQIPIILALYRIFLLGGLPMIHSDILYSFVSQPAMVDMHFLGIDLAAKSIPFALLTGLSQYFQAKFAIPPQPPHTGKEKSFQADFAKTMNLQMRYVLPALVGVISFTLPVAVSLYWVTSNLFAIAQELYVRRHRPSATSPVSVASKI